MLFVGANHNFFNREWRFDDNRFLRVCPEETLIGAPAQRGMLEIVLADWIASQGAGATLPSYQRAEAASPVLLDRWAARPVDLRFSYASARRVVVDDFEGSSAPSVNDLGGTNAFAGYTASITCTDACSANYPHATGAVRLAWESAAATTRWPLGDLDASGHHAISMRFASRIATINTDVTEHDFAIRVVDADGTVAEVPLSRVGRLVHGYGSVQPREVLTSVRVPITVLTSIEPGLDPAHLAALELAMPIPSGNVQGSIWVADLDLAGD